MLRTATLAEHQQNHHDAIVESLMNETEENIEAAIATRGKLAAVKREVAEYEQAWPVTLKMKLLMLGWKNYEHKNKE